MVGNLGSREGETSKLKGFDYNVYRKSLLTDEMEKRFVFLEILLEL